MGVVRYLPPCDGGRSQRANDNRGTGGSGPEKTVRGRRSRAPVRRRTECCRSVTATTDRTAARQACAISPCERLYVNVDGGINHEFTEPFGSLLTGELRAAAIEHYRSDRVTSPDPVDQAWEELSGLWAAELEQKQQHPCENARVLGVSMTCLVGRPGLEPGTLGLKVPCSNPMS